MWGILRLQRSLGRILSGVFSPRCRSARSCGSRDRGVGRPRRARGRHRVAGDPRFAFHMRSPASRTFRSRRSSRSRARWSGAGRPGPGRRSRRRGCGARDAREAECASCARSAWRRRSRWSTSPGARASFYRVLPIVAGIGVGLAVRPQPGALRPPGPAYVPAGRGERRLSTACSRRRRGATPCWTAPGSATVCALAASSRCCTSSCGSCRRAPSLRRSRLAPVCASRQLARAVDRRAPDRDHRRFAPFGRRHGRVARRRGVFSHFGCHRCAKCGRVSRGARTLSDLGRCRPRSPGRCTARTTCVCSRRPGRRCSRSSCLRPSRLQLRSHGVVPLPLAVPFALFAVVVARTSTTSTGSASRAGDQLRRTDDWLDRDATRAIVMPAFSRALPSCVAR